MAQKIVKIHPDDNVLVALSDLKAREKILYNNVTVTLKEDIQAKHKFVEKTLKPDDEIKMYGVVVGKAMTSIQSGAAITTKNVKHKSAEFEGKVM
jgi:altronate hydrolase